MTQGFTGLTRRWRTAVVLVALLPLLSSCFTMGLWGFKPERDHDQFTGKRDDHFSYDAETEWSWTKLFGRIAGTPITLALDCLTAPVQAWFFRNDDDDEDGRRRRRRGCT